MKEINSFILYYDWQLLFKNFSLEQKGILLDSIFKYVSGKLSSDDVDLSIKDVFDYMITYINRDKEKYIKKCEKMEENARKRYEKKKIDEESKNNITIPPALKKAMGNSHGACYDLEEFERRLNEDD